jgi:hypothetical protein
LSNPLNKKFFPHKKFLFYFSFFEYNMSTNYRIIFEQMQLVGCIGDIFPGRIEKTGPRRGDQFDGYRFPFSPGHTIDNRSVHNTDNRLTVINFATCVGNKILFCFFAMFAEDVQPCSIDGYLLLLWWVRITHHRGGLVAMKFIHDIGND